MRKIRTLHWDELPHWLRDNHYIHTGYRAPSGSFKRSLHSLSYVHNETVNIYSHLLPSIILVPVAVFVQQGIAARYETASRADVWAFACFFAGAVFCLGMSATFHTVSNHSPVVARFGNALDYLGIVGLITGSFIPSVFYGFYCHAQLQMLYWAMIISIGIACTIVTMMGRFRTPAWRPFRAGMFVSMGLSAVFPVLHGLSAFGLKQLQKQLGLNWLLLQGFLYILGASIYAIRAPERWYPGRFDIVGSSHQIFHVLVVLAAMAHLNGLFKAYDYRHGGQALDCVR